MSLATTTSRFSIVVLISGCGSNLQAIIDAIDNGTLHAEIKAVISNRSDAYGLRRATAAGIETRTIDHRSYPDRETFDAALQQCIDHFSPELVVLAGFMRILTPAFVDHYHGRLINIHPSLLPQFAGLDTHRRAIEAGVREHGASIHFVTNKLDGGPVISHRRVAVLADDNSETLAARVLTQEHILYPETIEWFVQRRIHEQNGKVVFDGQVLDRPLEPKD